MAKGSKNYHVEIRILQNGTPIKDVNLPLKTSGLLSLSSREGDLLGLNLYPLSRNIPILKITKNEAQVFIDHAWEGFVVSKGKMVDVLPHKSLGETYVMKPDDFASLAWHDLRLLIYIREPISKTKSRWGSDSRYISSPFSTLINDKWQWGSNLLAASVCLFMFAAFRAGLLSLPNPRPEVFEDLDNSYTLPFISAEILKVAPEVLQENLEVDRPIRSLMNWHRNYLNNAFSWKQTTTIPDHRFLGERAMEEKEEVDGDLRKIEGSLDSLSEAAKNSPIAAQIQVPVIMGPSFSQKVLAVLERFEYISNNGAARLETKKQFQKSFAEESGYNWDDYQRNKKTQTNEALTTIAQSSFGIDQEKALYAQFDGLSKRADAFRREYFLGLEDKMALSEAAGIKIKTSPGVVGLSKNSLPILDLRKLAMLPVSTFGSKEKADKPLEPLTGKVDQASLRQALLSQRMEIQLCYEAALRRNMGQKGKMRWEWILDTEGQITDIQLVRSEIVDNDMARCVRRKISVFKLPKPKLGSVKISHIFDFRPEKNL
jgi:hypothetical protein